MAPLLPYGEAIAGTESCVTDLSRFVLGGGSDETIPGGSQLSMPPTPVTLSDNPEVPSDVLVVPTNDEPNVGK